MVGRKRSGTDPRPPALLLCLCISTTYPNCVDNFPASRLTGTFVWNVKNQTSKFCASVSDTGSEAKSFRGLPTTTPPTATTNSHHYNPNNVNETFNHYQANNGDCIYC